MSFSWFRIWQN